MLGNQNYIDVEMFHQVKSSGRRRLGVAPRLALLILNKPCMDPSEARLTSAAKCIVTFFCRQEHAYQLGNEYQDAEHRL